MSAPADATRLYRGRQIGDRWWGFDTRAERTVRAADAMAAARMLGGFGSVPTYLRVIASGERLVLKDGVYVTEDGR